MKRFLLTGVVLAAGAAVLVLLAGNPVQAGIVVRTGVLLQPVDVPVVPVNYYYPAPYQRYYSYRYSPYYYPYRYSPYYYSRPYVQPYRYDYPRRYYYRPSPRFEFRFDRGFRHHGRR